jgi:hypothetical protein
MQFPAMAIRRRQDIIRRPGSSSPGSTKERMRVPIASSSPQDGTRPRAPRSMRLPLWLAVVIALLLALGWLSAFAGYHANHPAPPWGDEAAFRVEASGFASAHLFGGLQSLRQAGSDPLLLAGALALPVALGLLLAVAAWLAGRNAWNGWRIRRRGGHVVLAGDGRAAARVLAWGRPLLWLRDARLTLAERVDLPGHCAVLHARADDRRTGLARAAQALFLANDGSRNVREALRLLERPGDGEGLPRQVLAATTGRALIDTFEQRLAALHLPGNTEARAFSVAEAGTRRLFLGAPLERFRHAGGSGLTRAVVFGFGDWGQEVVRALLLESHPVAPRRVEITIVDRNATHLEKTWKENLPDWPLLPAVHWVPLDTDNSAALATLVDELGRDADAPVAWFVCLGKGEQSYVTALRIEAALEQALLHVPPVFFCSDAFCSDARHGMTQDPGRTPGALQAFGALDEALDEELVLQETRDALAKHIHQRYLDACFARGGRPGERPAWVPWERLPHTFRRENRSQADHHFCKLRQIGCRLRPGTAATAFAFSGEEPEALAVAEHQRWCASRILSGWRHGSVRDDARRVHTDLVAYDALPEAVKELDRDAVRNLPVLFGEMGLVPVRELVVAAAGIAVADAVSNVARLHALLTGEFPARHPVLLVDAGDAGQRAAGRAWLAGGHELWLALAEPLHLLLGRADAATRDELMLLAQSAACRIALHGTDVTRIATHRLACGERLAVEPIGAGAHAHG